MNKCADTLIASHPLSQQRGNVGSMIQVASGKVCFPLLMPLVSCIKAVCLRLPALSLARRFQHHLNEAGWRRFVLHQTGDRFVQTDVSATVCQSLCYVHVHA